MEAEDREGNGNDLFNKIVMMAALMRSTQVWKLVIEQEAVGNRR